MSELRRNSFTFRIVDNWNALPAHVVRFEIELDKYMGDEMLDFSKFRCRVKLCIYNYVNCNKRYGLRGSESAYINILLNVFYTIRWWRVGG